MARISKNDFDALEGGSQTLAKGLLVLEAVAANHHARGIRLVDICKDLNFNKTTAYRLVSTLEHLGYVVKDPESERYHLGLKLLSLTSSLLESFEVRSIASPFLNELMLQTKQAVHLVVLDQEVCEVVYIDKVDSPQPVRMYTTIGSRYPANCTAAGKAIMAYLPSHVLNPMLNHLRASTPNSIISADQLRLELENVRVKGYSFDNEENVVGVVCIGAPIFNHLGKVIASISISATLITIKPDEFLNLHPLVQEAAARVSQKMGYR